MTRPVGQDAFMKSRIAERDKLHLDPNERAERVNTFIFTALGLTNVEDLIQHPLYWDLVCWSQEFLNAFAFGSQNPEHIALTKAMNAFIYSLHYSLPNNSPELGPDRAMHDSIWAERIEAF